MKKSLLFLLGLMLFTINSMAQPSDDKDVANKNTVQDLLRTDSVTVGQSTIVFSQIITEEYVALMDSIDSKTQDQAGFRIQLQSVSGPNAKESIFKLQSEFLSIYPDLDSYANWSSPNWVLRVGNYRTRLEASQTLENLKTDYPAAFILADQIESPFKK